jgi:hypothetical protein
MVSGKSGISDADGLRGCVEIWSAEDPLEGLGILVSLAAQSAENGL